MSARTRENPLAWRPDEREPVGVEAGRREAQDHVPGPGRAAVDDPRPLHDADAAARQVELVRLHDPWVLGRLAADERGTRLATAGGHATDELGDIDWVQDADRQVVEERERLGAGAHDVVGAHGDEVDADRVEAPDRRRDRGFGADAVRGGDHQRLAVARRDRERPAEPAETTDDLGPARRVHVLAHELDRPLARVDVNAGTSVRRAFRCAHEAGTLNVASPRSHRGPRRSPATPSARGLGPALRA